MTSDVPPLVDATWVAARLSGPGAVVPVEVATDASAYLRAALPGSHYLDRLDDLQEPQRRAIVDRARLEEVLTARGLRPEDHLVLYGDDASPAYAYWLLRHHGHRRLSLLDGGRRAWLAAGQPLAADPPPPAAGPPYRSGEPDPSVRLGRDALLARLAAGLPGTAVLDCRSRHEYDGHPGDVLDLPLERHRVNGHVAGATNVPAASLLAADGRLLPLAALRAVLAPHARPDQEVVVYCRVGERSGLVWFVLHELLRHPSPVRLYDGGWAEYGSLVDVPVSRRPAPLAAGP